MAPPPIGNSDGSYNDSVGTGHSFPMTSRRQYRIDAVRASGNAPVDMYRNHDINEGSRTGSSMIHNPKIWQANVPNTTLSMAALPSSTYPEPDLSTLGNHSQMSYHTRPSSHSSFSTVDGHKNLNPSIGVTPQPSSPPPLPTPMDLTTGPNVRDDVIDLTSSVDYAYDPNLTDTSSSSYANLNNPHGKNTHILNPQGLARTTASNTYPSHYNNESYNFDGAINLSNLPNLATSGQCHPHYFPQLMSSENRKDEVRLADPDSNGNPFIVRDINLPLSNRRAYSQPPPPPKRVSVTVDSRVNTPFQRNASAIASIGKEKEQNNERLPITSSRAQIVTDAQLHSQSGIWQEKKPSISTAQVKGQTTQISGMTQYQRRDWNTTVISNWPGRSFETFTALATNTDILFNKGEEVSGLIALRKKQQDSEEKRNKDRMDKGSFTVSDTSDILQKLMANKVFTSTTSDGHQTKESIVLAALVDAVSPVITSDHPHDCLIKQILAIGIVQKGGKEIRHLASRVLDEKHDTFPLETPQHESSDYNSPQGNEWRETNDVPKDAKRYDLETDKKAVSTSLLAFGDCMIDSGMFQKFTQCLDKDDDGYHNDRLRILSEEAYFKSYARKIIYPTLESWTHNVPQIHGLDPTTSNAESDNQAFQEWEKVLVRVPLKTFPVVVNPSSTMKKPTVSISLNGFGFLPMQYFIHGQRDETAIFGSYFPAVYDMKNSSHECQTVDDSFATSKNSVKIPTLAIRGGGMEITESRAENALANHLKEESYRFLRQLIRRTSSKEESTDDNPNKETNDDDTLYPNAPLAEVWVTTTKDSKKMNEEGGDCSIKQWNIASGEVPHINEGGTLLGRKWVWDEGHYTDGDVSSIKSDAQNANEGNPDEKSTKRRSGRSTSSVHTSNVLSELASGKLNPYTLVECENYAFGPEFRFLREDNLSNLDCEEQDIKVDNKIQNFVQKSSDMDDYKQQHSNLTNSEIQPFIVRVCPDALMLADLHAHLSESEIIGFLGGRYEPTERCIYIQGAFPCKSTVRTDGGHTDVEMDPVSQITVNDCIISQGLAVVGWYHSHPKFQPDPSITDIENQQNYQKLYDSVLPMESGNESVCPFVGLIVGTYGSKNPSSSSVMRWFHITNLKKENGSPDEVAFPKKLEVVHRKLRIYGEDLKPKERIESSEVTKRKFTRHGTLIRHNKDLAALKSKLGIFPDHNCDSLPQEPLDKSEEEANTISILKSSKKHDDPRIIKDTIDKVFRKILSDELIELGQDGVLVLETSQKKKFAKLSDIISSSHTEAEESPTSYLLPYNNDEINILCLGAETGVTNDHRAGVIWNAIEREQLSANTIKIECLGKEMKLNPPSSECILQSLLDRLVGNAECHSCREAMRTIALDDAVLVHMMDTVIIHYANSSNKIDPFKSWSGAPDIPIQDASNNSAQWKWQKYYVEHVMRSDKMKRGHKITSCLLEWASHMHLNDRDRWSRNKANDDTLGFNHERDPLQKLPKDVEFVSEMMRLLAARWRESTLDNKMKTKARSTRATRSKAITPKVETPTKRRRGRATCTRQSSKQPETLSSSRKRRSPR